MEKSNLIEKTLSKNKKIKLKIYVLEYIIESNDNKYTIYPVLYQNRKYTYNSLIELFKNYTIYNEPIIQNMEKVKIIT